MVGKQKNGTKRKRNMKKWKEIEWKKIPKTNKTKVEINWDRTYISNKTKQNQDRKYISNKTKQNQKKIRFNQKNGIKSDQIYGNKNKSNEERGKVI